MIENLQEISQYNLWGNPSLEVGYLRELYTKSLVEASGSSLVKVLVGQRRTGKSYVLRQVAKALVEKGVASPKDTLIINKELRAYDFIRTADDLERFIRSYASSREGRPLFVFIDEVQMVENWEKAVNSLSQDYTQRFCLYISGSNSKMLSGELATLLSGRYLAKPVYTFSYAEFCGITGKAPAMESYLEYMKSGGLPELFWLSTEELRANYISSLRDTVLLRDIIARYKVRMPSILSDIFSYLVNTSSNLQSIPNIVAWFKGKGSQVSYEVVADYVGYISDAFLCHKCERFVIGGKEVLGGAAKYYANDQAYHNYLFPGVAFGTGYLLENIVYLELLRQGYMAYTGIREGKEIDFVAKKGDKKIYIQVSYMLVDEDTRKREYAPFERIRDNYPKWVVSLDPLPLASISGIENVPAWSLEERLRWG
ncbi:MAG: ATP-binding protein [Bacteroidales bacterium]|nr:ATP-binding protein [Bacteroidales bacterium]MCD8393693.1 ATP-binding protein [Bacteroidales bacterium]